jgi:hypothetical protein
LHLDGGVRKTEPVNTTIIQRHTAVPASATLSAWQHHPWSDGVSIDQLSPLDRLVVRTLHSTYEIVASETGSADVLVRGGSFFPEFTPARLAGASLGGSFLKLRSVHVGFAIEFAVDNRAIVTSPVRSISVASAGAVSEVM